MIQLSFNPNVWYGPFTELRKSQNRNLQGRQPLNKVKGPISPLKFGSQRADFNLTFKAPEFNSRHLKGDMGPFTKIKKVYSLDLILVFRLASYRLE